MLECSLIGMLLTLLGGAWYGWVEMKNDGLRLKTPIMPLVNPRQ